MTYVLKYTPFEELDPNPLPSLAEESVKSHTYASLHAGVGAVDVELSSSGRL